MIQTIITHTCPDCGSSDLVKNGHDCKGDQKFHCKNHNRYGTLNVQKDYSHERREQVKRAVLERVSLRGIGHIFNMSRHTVSRWLKGSGYKRRYLSKIRCIRCSGAMCWKLAELWSFVGNKSQKRWLWLALCRRTRQVVAYWLGDRSEASAIRLWQRIPRTNAVPHLATSGRRIVMFLMSASIRW